MTNNDERGFALISTIIVSALLAALLTAYFVLTRMERATTLSSMSGNRGFHVAEAGLNLRAEQIRQTFLGYNKPVGSAPEEVEGQLPCLADPGAGDFQCLTYSFEGRDVVTYVRESPGNPTSIVVPPGELYQNLNAQAYRYAARSVSVGSDGRPEAILNMEFESRLVPLFQFAAFFNKDLEILPGNTMTLEGPVYCNGSMYLGAETTLIARGQLATTLSLFHGRKDYDACQSGSVQVYDPATLRSLPACGPGRRELTQDEAVQWNGMIRTRIDPVTVPEPEALDPNPGRIFWDRADIRIMVDVSGPTPSIEVRSSAGGIDAMATSILHNNCTDAVGYSTTLHNRREGKDIQMLEVDARELLECIHDNPLLMDGKLLDDTSDGGLVWYLGVDGADATGINPYGIRVTNGSNLSASDMGAPEIQGLTIVTNQAVYLEGSYNVVDKKPASLLGDSLNILSNDWQDTDAAFDISAPERRAADTMVNAAFLAGTDSTGGDEGLAFRDRGSYNGGLENFPRFHEDWGNATLTYRGSFVSLNRPQHVNGPWAMEDVYRPPIRDWSFDTDFNDAANLPPLSPRFVYLKQNLFVREFEL